MTVLSGWYSLQTLSSNTSVITGLYDGTDPNLTIATSEMTSWSTYVPKKMINPLAQTRSIIIGPKNLMATFAGHEANSTPGTSEAGLTVSVGKFIPSPVLVFTDHSPVTGIMTHEWGHAVDYQYQYAPGAAQGSSRSGQSDVQALWTRTQGLSNFNPVSAYGWTNILEYWAELFRFHWGGSTYGGNYVGSADASFRFLISGNTAGPDDSFTVSMHNIIGGLTPPPAPLPGFNS